MNDMKRMKNMESELTGMRRMGRLPKRRIDSVIEILGYRDVTVGQV